MTDDQIATLSAFTVAQLNTIIDDFLGQNDFTIVTANFVQINASDEAQYYCTTAIEMQGDLFISILPDGDYNINLDSLIPDAEVSANEPAATEEELN